MDVTRRQFLGSSAAVVVAGTMASGTAFGAHNRIKVACIGLHNRGKSHIEGFSKSKNSEVVALCDVDKNVLEERAKNLQTATKKKPKCYVDIRDLLADHSIDAVSIATPNHWHTLAAIWACQAGKDVYVEKPLSHNVWEGRQLAVAAKKHKCVVQHGTQSRSEEEWIRAMQRMREGAIGPVYMARALCYKRRDAIGFGKPATPPANLEWNVWQGPAPQREYLARDNGKGLMVHYDWHWFWDYGNGDIGNQGVHQMDLAVWGLNKGFPVKVYSSGGRYGYQDQGETPNTLVTTFTYADGTMLVFEVRGRWTNDEAGATVGNLFYGADGYMVEAKFFNAENKEIPDPKPGAAKELTTGNCYENFLKAVRSRKEEDIHGTAQEGHVSSAHCHLANISFRLGRELRFDPAAERFVKDDEANAMLTRTYREPFVVPQLA